MFKRELHQLAKFAVDVASSAAPSVTSSTSLTLQGKGVATKPFPVAFPAHSLLHLTPSGLANAHPGKRRNGHSRTHDDLVTVRCTFKTLFWRQDT
jgi:hypothetical protein